MSKARAVANQRGSISDERFSYILGLDIGTASIGWALIETRNGRPVRLRLAGVRCFEAGVEGDIERGKDASRAASRRMARLQRRQLCRRANRLRRVFVELQRYGLLPECDWSSPARHERLKQFDAELQAKHVPENDVRAAQLLPYLLRAKGVTEPLTLHEFGRTLFHLGQRRGYRSNRKTDQQSESATDDEQPKKPSNPILE